jgi:LPS sulfotransferase NodH
MNLAINQNLYTTSENENFKNLLLSGNYLINVFTARSGSTWFSNLIAKNFSIYLEEFFNPELLAENLQKFQVATHGAEYVSKILLDDVRLKSTSNFNASFQITPSHLGIWLENNLFSDFFHNSNKFLIFLTRRNRFEQAISLIKANYLNFFHNKDNTKLSVELDDVFYDFFLENEDLFFQNINENISILLSEEKIIDDLKKLNTGNYIHLVYEDLLFNHNLVIDIIGKKLKLKPFNDPNIILNLKMSNKHVDKIQQRYINSSYFIDNVVNFE